MNIYKKYVGVVFPVFICFSIIGMYYLWWNSENEVMLRKYKLYIKWADLSQRCCNMKRFEESKYYRHKADSISVIILNQEIEIKKKNL